MKKQCDLVSEASFYWWDEHYCFHLQIYHIVYQKEMRGFKSNICGKLRLQIKLETIKTTLC